MANLFQPSLTRATDSNGNPVSNAKMNFYLTGTNTRATIYANQAGTTPFTNPVTANSSGVFDPIYMDWQTTYRVVLTDETGASVVWAVDPVRGYDESSAQTAADAAIAAKDLAVPAAAEADADRVAAQAALAATEAAQGIVTALLTGQGKPYANAYAATLPKGVTSVTIGGDPITGATVGEYAISGSGGSITGYSLTLVVTSATEAYVRVETNPDGSKATGLGSGTTPPTLTKPAGATLPAGTTLSAVVGSRIAVGEPYVVMSADGLEFLVYYNNAGAVDAFLDATSVQVAAPTSKGVAANSIHPGYADATVAEKAALACIDALELDGVPAGKYVSWKYIFWKDVGTRFNATLVMHDDLSGTGAADCCTFSVGAGADAWTTPQDITLTPSSGSTVTGKFCFTPPGAALTMNSASSTAAMYQRRRVSRRTYRALTPNNSERVTTAARYSSALRNPPADGFVHGVNAEAALYDFRGLSILPSFTLPTDLYISKVGRNASNNFFFAEISSVAAGVVAYTGPTSGAVLSTTGMNGYQEFKLWAFGTATIAPIGTYLGTFAFEIPADGVASGAYNVALTYAKSGLINSRIQSSTAITDTLIKNALLAYPGPSPLLSTVTDDYLRAIVEDIAIDNGVAGRTYVLNYRSDTSGSDRRLQFYLYDPVRGANVAIWQAQKTYDWASEVPESVYLSGASKGGIRGDVEYVGVGCTIFLKPGVVLFNKGASTFTTTAAGGINPNRVWSPEETERRILNGLGVRNKLRTFGPGGDFATLKAAVDSLLKPDLGAVDDVQRAWWPFSDICTPAHQWTLQAMPGHSEVKPAVIPAGVGFARGILTWMGMTIRIRNDTVIKGETTASVDTYAIDYNLGGRILMEPGALIWADSGVAVHSDAANALSIPSVANAADKTAGQQFFRIVGLLEGGRYKSDLQAWSCGVSDGCRIIFRRTVFETTGSGANWATHTSPSNVAPGYYEFDDVTLVGGTKSISLTTSNTVAARHGIRVVNSDVTAVSGGAGYVRIGKQPGVTYSATMEP